MQQANGTKSEEVPLCVACKVDTAYYDEARMVYSKFCSGDCQQLHEKYENAVLALKACIQEDENIIDPNDFPPPRCTNCQQGGSKLFDYNRKSYIENCHFCLNQQQQPHQQQQQSVQHQNPQMQQGYNPYVPQQGYQQQPQPFQGYQQSPPQKQQTQHVQQSYPAGTSLQHQVSPPLSARPGNTKPGLNRTVHRVANQNRPPPTQSASRMYYNKSSIADRGSLCAHCFLRNSSPNTNLGLFCGNACESAESRVQGCGILVVSMDLTIVVLSFMTNGPYNGLWSLFHGAKNPQELARDCCVRISMDQGSQITAPNAQDPYTMVEHSTPNVFSYTVLVRRDNLQSYLPASTEVNGRKGAYCHVRIDQFRQPLTRDNIYVMDVNHKQRKVSRHTQKVILEWINNYSR